MRFTRNLIIICAATFPWMSCGLSEDLAPVTCTNYTITVDEQGARITILSDRPTAEFCTRSAAGGEWRCKTVVAHYFECIHLRREAFGVWVRIDGCATELW